MGRQLGHYRILERLGEGGMGEVYRAEDINLRRPVALKILPESLSLDPVARERLVREARSASRLNHPNIATIYEAGEQDGQLFIAMELVEGRPLLKLLRDGPLEPRHVAHIGAQVADALDHAHGHGVVHRDIKPGNILLRDDGTVKVVDFGLAMRTEAAAADRETEAITSTRTRPFESVAMKLTREGHAAGTVSYMSPEQARDGVAEPRSDLFSLGVVLYEAATGRVPFTGKNPFAVAASVIHDDPVPPRDVVAAIPGALQEIILRCLEKQPEARPQGAAAVREALLALEQGVTTMTVRRVLGRRPGARGLAMALLGAALLAALVSVIVLAWPEGARPVFADVEARRLYEQGVEYLSRGYIPSQMEFAVRNLEQALEREPGNPWTLAALANALGNLEMQYPEPGRMARVRELADAAIARRADLYDAWIARGRHELLEERPEAALEDGRRARRLSPRRHEAHVILGQAQIALGRTDEGLEELRRGIEVGKGHIFARAALANALIGAGRFDEAAAEYRTVLGYAPDFPSALNNLAAIYVMQGRHLEAIPLLEKSLRLHDDDVAASNLGTCYYHLDRMPEAIAAYLRAVEMGPADYPRHKRNLAEAYEKVGDQGAAADWYAKTVADCDRVIAGGSAPVEYVIDRAFCAAKLGRHGEARAALEGEVAQRPGDVFARYALAQVHGMAGRRDAAFELLRRCIADGYPRDEIRRDATFAAYRADPEFQRILSGPGGGS